MQIFLKETSGEASIEINFRSIKFLRAYLNTPVDTPTQCVQEASCDSDMQGCALCGGESTTKVLLINLSR